MNVIDLKSEKKEKCVFSSLVRQISLSLLTWLDQTLGEAGLFEHKDCVFCEEDYGWMEEKEDDDGGTLERLKDLCLPDFFGA